MIDQNLKILLIEDNPGDRLIVSEHLKDAFGKHFQMDETNSLKSGCEKSKSGCYDVILLDIHLPDSEGIDTLKKLENVECDSPVIILTGAADDELASLSIEFGAQDFIQKKHLSPLILSKTIELAIERNKIRNKLVRRTQLLNTIRKINKLITHVSSRRELIDETCKVLSETKENLHSWIVLFGADGKVELSAENNIGENFRKFINFINEGKMPACVLENIDTGIPAVIKKEDETCGDCPLKHHSHSGTYCANMKLTRGEKLYGLLHVHISNNIFDDAIEVGLIEELAEDISLAIEHILSERKIAESEDRFKKMILNSNDAIYLLNKGKFEIINNKFEELFCYNLEEVNSPAFNFMQMVSEKSKDLIIERSERVKRGEHVPPIYEFTALSKDGEEIECETRVTYIDYHGGTAVLGVLRDITDRKYLEETLQKYSMAVRQSPAFMVITDRDGIIEFANPSFLHATGYTLQEIQGKNPRIFKSGHQPKEFYTELWQTILSGQKWEGEFLNKKKNGELYWESVEIAPIFNDKGEIISFLKVSRDITELKNAAIEIKRAKEKAESGDRLKSEFLNQISHEVRTPLHAMSGFIEILDDTLSNNHDEIIRDSIRGLRLESSRIIRMMDSLINLASINSRTFDFEPKKTNFSELVDRVCKS